jgi:hypothetical protein
MMLGSLNNPVSELAKGIFNYFLIIFYHSIKANLWPKTHEIPSNLSVFFLAFTSLEL